MKIIIYIILTSLCFSCTSINVAKKVKADVKSGKVPSAKDSAVVPVPIETEPVIVEQPIWMPNGTVPLPKTQGQDAVEQSLRKGILKPQDYSKAAMLYDYNADWMYEVYCQPLRATDLCLKAGEKAVETPFISDSERWMLVVCAFRANSLRNLRSKLRGAGVSYDAGVPVQHIYVKPTEANISATLIINTNERVYHLLVRSFADAHMPMVRWRYHETDMPKNYIKETAPGAVSGGADGGIGIDPRFLSFNYKITYGWFNKPRWLPKLAYDDGKKTYITFPEDALVSEMPAVFENRADVVNYRVARNVIIIDKLIEKITVKIGKKRIVIQKKRGKK
jgi:type IV secretion system protein VirB9